ncbi:MAG: M14 family metallopeptidase [Acidobacteria bacterium]|nr:M14 family metallopeptidase [Acidobacteriota bacterium]
MLRRISLTLALSLCALSLAAQSRITTPLQEFGFEVGADYHLINYTQMEKYWQKLARESDRMKLVDIGKTEEGRPQWMAIISSPANLKRLDHYQQISKRLALADGLTDDQAHELAAEGKAVVWIDGGLHSTETVGSQQLIEMVYQMVSRDDRETKRFLDDVILLAVLSNPDGMELVANWYMRDKDPRERRLAAVPRLYQKYIGHDNNRDSFMSTQAETTNMGRVLYKDWIPQVMYNHHQSGPVGTVLWAPPFREPYSYRFDPLILTGIDVVAAAMHNRFAVEGKPGATERKGAPYSNWFNGGLRSTTCYHNIIGLLTEMIGNPTPMEIPFVAARQLMTYDNPNPIVPQKWHFRQSIEYSITANRAVLDVASRNRELLLYNIYRMGKNSIERGSRDHWTILPKHVEGAKTFEQLRDPAQRDPRVYVIPANQRDFLTAIKFVHALQKTGIVVHRAARAFSANGREFPAGSFVVKTAQAFRPHVLDMFEPQNYPNDFQYPGGPPIPPYDNAGWTAAFQMGIEFHRLLDDVAAPLIVAEDPVRIPAGKVEPGTSGWELTLDSNDAYRALNALGTTAMVSGNKLYAPASAQATVERLATEMGLSFKAAAAEGKAVKVPRVALLDVYGGSMPSGWMRWLFERYGFQFEVIYPETLNKGDLSAKYDVIVMPQGTYGREGAREGAGGGQPKPEAIPAEFRGWLGYASATTAAPQLKSFVEAGGTVIALGSSTRLAADLKLPLTNHLMERLPSGTERVLPREKYYIPGSLLRAAVDTRHPATTGITPQVDLYFDSSPVFRLAPDAAQRGVTALAWFDGPAPLRSGWAWGQHYLDGGVVAAVAKMGQGRVYLFGPEMTFRAQPHGTFKFVFNAIHSMNIER